MINNKHYTGDEDLKNPRTKCIIMAAIQLQPPPYELFDCRAEGKNVRWTKWLRRLENNVFKGCGIVNAEQKKGLLLMYGGSDLNDIVDSFDDNVLAPIAAVPAQGNQVAVEAQDVYQRLTAAITAHFNPQANLEFQRYLFKQAVQTSPDIDEFYSTLRQLAATCEFANTDGEIKSQLIYGCKQDKVRNKGLSEPDVTLQQLIQYARNLEITQAHSKAMKGQSVNAIERHKQQFQRETQQNPQQKHGRQTQKPHQTHQPAGNTTKTCRNCGKQWHKTRGPTELPIMGGKKCKTCGKLNHFEKVCMSAQVKHISQESNNEEDTDYTYQVNIKPRRASSYFEIKIGSSTINMMADSGASVNLLAKTDFNNLQPKPPLQVSSARIFAYGETSPISTLGEFTTELRYKERSCQATIIVVQNGPSSLLSWETSQQLKLLSVVNAVANNEVDHLVNEYPELFTGLGKLRDYKVRLHIDDSVQPVAQTHRRIPFHIRKDLEAQLKKMDEDLGVIQRPTGPTPWVSPVV